ncbi:hypothetical protein H4582DRAFT_2060281 [Lactarius indigo]|nr:hypothetical protein H4582DRAFT_2060281 [Lactarius indigo]
MHDLFNHLQQPDLVSVPDPSACPRTFSPSKVTCPQLLQTYIRRRTSRGCVRNTLQCIPCPKTCTCLGHLLPLKYSQSHGLKAGPAQAMGGGLGLTFSRPKPLKAGPKLQLSGQAGLANHYMHNSFPLPALAWVLAEHAGVGRSLTIQTMNITWTGLGPWHWWQMTSSTGHSRATCTTAAVAPCARIPDFSFSTMHLWSEPLSITVWDDWSQMSPHVAILDRLLCLSFTVSGTEVVAVGPLPLLSKSRRTARRCSTGVESIPNCPVTQAG